jgi:hypothetical protein
MWGLALVLGGLPIAALGVRMALERGRPLDLAGMLVAPLGLCLALLGAGRMLSPVFFGRDAAAPRALRIMPAGDDLTRGAAGGRDRGGYRGPLWARLLARGRGKFDLVGAESDGPFAIDRDHQAFAGATADGLAARLQEALPVHAPEVVLLLVGSHDLLAGASPDVVVGRLAALLDGGQARWPRAQWLVGALVGGPGLDPGAVAAVNAGLRAAVLARAARGEPCRYVDLRARVGQAADFSGDGLHLSERGNEQLAQAWLEALDQSGPRASAGTRLPGDQPR